jgi:hypothetical protein
MDYVNLTINLKLEEVLFQLYVIKEAEYVGYGLYLYFLGLSTRKVAKALSFLHIVKRSHVSIWTWIQTYKPAKLISKRRKISEFVVVETMILVSS